MNGEPFHHPGHAAGREGSSLAVRDHCPGSPNALLDRPEVRITGFRSAQSPGIADSWMGRFLARGSPKMNGDGIRSNPTARVPGQGLSRLADFGCVIDQRGVFHADPSG